MNIQSINYACRPQQPVSFQGSNTSATEMKEEKANLPDSYKRVEFFRNRFENARNAFNTVKNEKDREYFAKRCHTDGINLLAACKASFKDQTGLDLLRISQVYDNYELSFKESELAKKYYPELYIDIDDMNSFTRTIVYPNGLLGSSSAVSER